MPMYYKYMNTKTKNNKRLFTLIFILIFTLLISVFGYNKYTQYQNLKQREKSGSIAKAELAKTNSHFEEVKYALEQEKQRCESFVSKEEGNFSEFTYCQKFLEFVSTIPHI